MFIPSTGPGLFSLHFIRSSLSPLTYLQFFQLLPGAHWIFVCVFTGSANFASQPPSQLSNPPCRPCGSGKLAADVNMSLTRVVNTGLSNDILQGIWEDKWCEYESHINYWRLEIALNFTTNINNLHPLEENTLEGMRLLRRLLHSSAISILGHWRLLEITGNHWEYWHKH